MENGLVTADGTKVLTVEEYDRLVNAIPGSMKAIFEINTITGLRYIELQKLYEILNGTTKKEIRLYYLKKHRKSKSSLKGLLINCLQLSLTCFYILLMVRNHLIDQVGIRIQPGGQRKQR